MESHGMFFDQEKPERPIIGVVAEEDRSPGYEVNACAVFACKDGGFLIVEVSGCSCWPYMGGTTQTFCEDKAAVSRTLTNWPDLLDACQQAKWKVR